MECKGCGRYISSYENKGTDTIPLCKTCADNIVRQNANIKGNNNVINQHFGGSGIEGCYFCSEEAITRCIECRKPLCETHKYTILGKDRCEQHNNLQVAKMAGQGVVGTVKGTLKAMSWLGSLWGR